MIEITDPFRKYPSIGRCIYCGQAEADVRLSVEHIIPYAIAGDGIIFEKASCEACARKFNSDFEQYMLRKIFGAFRFKYDAPTRNRRSRPKTMDLMYVTRSALTEAPVVIHVKKYERGTYPLDLICLRLKQPKILTGQIASEYDKVDTWSNIKREEIVRAASNSSAKRIFVGEFHAM